jgi:hypothetical protein
LDTGRLLIQTAPRATVGRSAADRIPNVELSRN